MKDPNETALRRKAARLIRRKSRDPAYKYPSGAPNCTQLAEHAAEILEIEPDEYHWIWELAIKAAYDDET
jgi:hypothetical protein